MAMQPYLLAFCERKANGLTRSMLTAVARVGPNMTLFATCKHVVTQMNGLFIVDENGTMMQSKGGAIPAVHPVLDLIFLFIRQDVPSNRIRLNESPISRDRRLTHARNKFGETGMPSPFLTHSATTRQSSFRAELGWSDDDNDIRSKFLENDGDIEEARREGVQTFYRVLEMESWTGE